jgi:hypothetical protein
MDIGGSITITGFILLAKYKYLVVNSLPNPPLIPIPCVVSILYPLNEATLEGSVKRGQ